MPKVSIIVPVYNVEQYLSQCLTSILNQTFRDFEVICINDGSTDNSSNILNEFSKKDDRIIVINEKNRGPGFTRNIGIKKAKGDYIYFVDSDDYIDETAISKLYSNARKNKSDIVITKIARDRDNTIDYSIPGFDLENTFKDVDFNNFTFDYTKIKNHVMNSSFAPWTKLYSKKFLSSNNEFFFQTDIAFEDVLFHIKVMLQAKKISFLPDFVYFYRIRTDNSMTSTKEHAFDILRVCEDVETYMKENDFFEYFEGEFVLFKIKQLINYLNLSKSEKYYKKTRKFFIKVNDKYLTNPFYNRNYIPHYLLNDIELIVNSKTMESYKLRIEINKLYDEKSQLMREKTGIEEKYIQIESDNDNLKMENKTLEEEKKKLETENNTLQTEHNTLQTEHNTLQTEHNTLQTEHNNLKEENSTLKNKYEIDSKKLEESLLKNQLYSKQLDEAQNELNEYEKTLENNKKLINQLQKTEDLFKKNKKELNQQISLTNELKNKNLELKEKNEEYCKNNFRLNNENNKYSSTVLSLKKLIQSNENEISELRLQLNVSKENNEDLTLKLSNLILNYDNIKNEKEYLQNKVYTTYHSFKKEQKEYEKINRNLNENLEDLKMKYQDVNDKLNQQNEKIRSLNEEKQELNNFKNSVLNSNSWRFTKPLRSIKNSK